MYREMGTLCIKIRKLAFYDNNHICNQKMKKKNTNQVLKK